MKIAVDLTIIRSEKKITGIERVAIQTLENFLSNKALREQNEFIILCAKGGLKVIKNLKTEIDFRGVQVHESPFTNRILTDQIWMPKILNAIRPEHVYYTTLGFPAIQQFPFTIIIHDAVAWVKSETISKGMRFYYKPLIEKAVKNKNLKNIITVSEFSKKEICKALKVPADKIFVNYLGVSPSFQKNLKLEKEDRILREYGIERDYIIAIGTLEPRKNLQSLFYAFEKLVHEFNYKGKLVIVGRKGWNSDFIIPEEIAKKVIFTGYVEEEHLPFLLKGAKVFVFPSLYEGFGLPLLEAMSVGVPVATSNQASLPEVGGGACEYFNPNDIQNIAEVIFRVVSNDSLQKRLSQRGIEHSQKFSWRQHANNIIEIIQESN
ncbi:glycosyltransferase family 4 protein [Bacillus wiedmannii]|uniref:glycosyltransferase family 4 protein n=1 Tax=Bacillus wiedmannii TaxID=1890302 RepID=UPI000BF6798F|nr:glycosyltransferase family 1 protein [Bacillus wiedmannii]PEP23317.1 mannosyl transferase [Bacillus wiedmannii]